MKILPTLTTPRLLLRAFTFEDAPEVQRLAGEREVASTTLGIPHPYENGMAEQWISTHREKFEQGQEIIFALELRSDRTLVGAIDLRLKTAHDRAEIGYWVGKPHWNRGYCTEAAAALLAYGFETLGLNRIMAHHLSRNPASGRVMQKIGMRHEGRLRQHTKKWEVYEDIEIYGILRSEYLTQ
ncbi:MAG: GNAT family N-acetyltransferase [Calditrichaceae bacterium]|nr:GNAT family N-acetyltransferase [Calditrichia bacterium]NUQ44184.1 GNAT family N-acetyltransferase [Calditrichaceae bacterium]